MRHRIARACAALLLVGSSASALADEAYDPDEFVNKLKEKYQPSIRACYDAGLKRNSDLEGRISLTVNIAKDGKVKDAKIEGFDPDIDACIAKEAKKWRFAGTGAERVGQIALTIKPLAAVDAPADTVTKINKELDEHYRAELETCLPKPKVKKTKKKKAPPPPKPKSVTFTFLLRMDGSVRDLAAKGLDKKGNKCLVEKGKSWAFPEAAGPSFYLVTDVVELGGGGAAAGGAAAGGN